MKTNLVLCAAFCMAGLAAASAALADDIMSGAIGNTITVESGGAVSTYVFNADKTWSAIMPDKSTARGAYTYDDKQICLSFSEPASMAKAPPQCSPLQAHKVGDTWTSPGPNGTTLKLTMSAGHG